MDIKTLGALLGEEHRRLIEVAANRDNPAWRAEVESSWEKYKDKSEMHYLSLILAKERRKPTVFMPWI